MADNVIELVIRTVDQATAQLKGVSDSVDGLGDSLKSLAGFAGTAFAAFESFKFVVTDIEETQNAVAQLDAAFKATGATLGLTRDALDGIAGGLSRVSTSSTTTVAQAESILLTFDKIQGDTFPRTLQAAADLAARLGESLPQAAEQLGRALQDPAQGLESLRRAGVTFTQDQRDQIAAWEAMGQTAKAQAIIIDEIEKRFSGSAAAAAGTLSGRITQLKNAFEDLVSVASKAPEVGHLTDAIDLGATGIHQLADALNGGPVAQQIDNITAAIKRLQAEAAAHGGHLGIFDTYNLQQYEQQLEKLQGHVASIAPGLPAMKSTAGADAILQGTGTDLDQFADSQAQAQLYGSEAKSGQTMATFKLNSDWLTEQQKALDELTTKLEDAQRTTQTVQEKAEAADSKFVDDIRLLEQQGQISDDEGRQRLLAPDIKPLDLDALQKSAEQAAPPNLGKENKQLTDQYTQAIKGIQDAFDHMFASINEGWKGMAKGFIDAIQQMVDQLLASQLTQLLFGKEFTDANGTTQVTGGLFGGLLSLLGLGQTDVISAGNYSDFLNTIGIPSFAGGGTAPGGLALVGENGPELVNLPSGAQVYNHQQLAGLGAGGTTIHYAPQPSIVIQGGVDQFTLGKVMVATATMINNSHAELIRTMKRNGYPLRT